MKTLILITLLSICSLSLPDTDSAMPSADEASVAVGCKIRLLSLKCNSTEDTFGEDEIYVLVGREQTSIIDINDNQEKDLSNLQLIICSDGSSMKLYDYDNGRNDSFDPDDLLGSHTIRCQSASKGSQYAYFNGQGASYILTYEVY